MPSSPHTSVGLLTTGLLKYSEKRCGIGIAWLVIESWAVLVEVG